MSFLHFLSFFCLLFPSFSLIFGRSGLLSPLNDDFYPMKSVIFEDSIKIFLSPAEGLARRPAGESQIAEMAEILFAPQIFGIRNQPSSYVHLPSSFYAGQAPRVTIYPNPFLFLKKGLQPLSGFSPLQERLQLTTGSDRPSSGFWYGSQALAPSGFAMSLFRLARCWPPLAPWLLRISYNENAEPSVDDSADKVYRNLLLFFRLAKVLNVSFGNHFGKMLMTFVVDDVEEERLGHAVDLDFIIAYIQ